MACEIIRMAVRNIRRNARRSLLCGAMVTFGVASVLFAKAYLVGLKVLIAEGVIDAGYGALQVTHQGYAKSQDMSPLSLDLPEDDALATRLSGLDNVRGVAPRLQFMGIVSGPENSAAFRALSIEPAREGVVCPKGPARVTDRLVGAPLSGDDAAEAILGNELADGLGVRIGDHVTLSVTTRTGSAEALDATVVGTYHFDDFERNKRLVVLPLRFGQRLVHMKGRVTSYTLAVHDLNRLKPTLAAVNAVLAGAPGPAEAQDWGALAPHYRDIIVIMETVLGLMLFIVFGLVLIGVVNAMLMSVFERTREIGTLLSMGFSRRRIAGLFLCEAAALGVLAAVIGAGLGSAITLFAHHHGIAFYAPGVGDVLTRPVLAGSYVVVALVGAISGALAGGVWPAWRASRLRPVDALASH
jgi:putative ABC transport system permease protein